MIDEAKAETKLEALIQGLRAQLREMNYAYGALFIGLQNTNEFGFLFVEGMPHHIRMQMLNDMQEALIAARKRFQV
jgi:hypothetical protein